MHYISLQADGSLHGMDKMFSIYAGLADARNELLSDTQGYHGHHMVSTMVAPLFTDGFHNGIIISI